jgi:hypothetical protein
MVHVHCILLTEIVLGLFKAWLLIHIQFPAVKLNGKFPSIGLKVCKLECFLDALKFLKFLFNINIVPTQYCAGGKIEKNEMGGACRAYGGGERRVQGFDGET